MGGVLASGRWHTMPKPVIYCADHPASALLEVFVHLGVDPEDLPEDYRLIAIEAPDGMDATRIAPEDLSSNWRSNTDETRGIGDAWFAAGRTPLLEVPSAIAPRTRIVLMNARHPEIGALRIVENEPVRFDPRLWK